MIGGGTSDLAMRAGLLVATVVACAPKPPVKDTRARDPAQLAAEKRFLCESEHLTDGGILQWQDPGDTCTWTCEDEDDPRARSGRVAVGNIVFRSLPDGGLCPSDTREKHKSLF